MYAKTLTAYSIRRFSHEQLCKIATAPVNKKKTEINKNISRNRHKYIIYTYMNKQLTDNSNNNHNRVWRVK